MRRRGIGKDAAEHDPLPATGIRWPRGGPRPGRLAVPRALRYLARWHRARVTAAITVTGPRPVLGTLDLLYPTRQSLGMVELDAEGVPVLHDLARARLRRAGIRGPAGGPA